MVQENENVSESNPNINDIHEVTSKPYRVTMEFPLFFTILSVSLSGKSIILFFIVSIITLNVFQIPTW